jgi:predicted small secreted protein
MMKKIFGCVAVVAAALSLGACSAADTASRNISYDSDNFKVMRRVVFVNGITDKYLLSIEGLCSITKDKEDLQLEVTCKTGEGEFKKHYLGISDNVTYFVEQMDASSVNTFHYKVAFRPETILPDIDMQTSGGNND